MVSEVVAQTTADVSPQDSKASQVRILPKTIGAFFFLLKE